MRDVAGGGDHQMIRREPISEAHTERVAMEPANCFRCAENRPAERMLRPEATGENFVEEILGVVQVHLDLFEDHLALFPNVVGIEFRAKNEIGNDVEGDRQVLIEDLGIEADLLFGGEGIEHAPDGVHFTGNVFGRASLRALEDHVFHEVGKAVLFGDFAAGTVADPNAYGDGTDVRHQLGDDHQAIGQNVLLDVARFASHKVILTQGGCNCHASREKKNWLSAPLTIIEW